MDNFYEVVILDDPIPEKQKPSKPEVFTPKIDKSSFAELPSMATIQGNLKKFSPESSKVNNEKQKIKQYIQSRTEIHQIDAKVQPIKRIAESKEVDRINISKVPFLPLLSIRTTAIEEVYKEIKELKISITDIEERNRVNHQCIEIGKLKLQDLEERHSQLKKKAGISCSVPEIREELQLKLKTLQKAWKTNTLILKKRIQELEEEAKGLGLQSEGLKNEIFRRREQHKNLTKNLNENSSNSEIGYHSCDLLNSSTQLRSVIRTPSWNSLSET
jgi:chromosome segregation ATPase